MYIHTYIYLYIYIDALSGEIDWSLYDGWMDRLTETLPSNFRPRAHTGTEHPDSHE